MSEKQRKLTDSRQAFVDAYCAVGQITYNNASESYKHAYPKCNGGHNALGARLTAKDSIKAAIDKKKAELAEKADVSREKYVKLLDKWAKDDESGRHNQLHAVSLVGDFCGFKRETAANPEREAAKQAVLAEETENLRLAELARLRTEQESREPGKPLRLVKGA